MKDTPAPKKSTPEAKKPKTARKITASYLENAGKFYLEKFPASSKHFRLIMGRKIRKSCQAHPDQSETECLKLLDGVVEKFERIGFLNDDAFIKGLLYSYRQRGWSRRKIHATLIQKGLSPALIEETLQSDDQPAESDFIQALKWVRKKRLGGFASGEPKPDRWLAALGRAGFDYETSRRALALSRDEIEDELSQPRG